MYPFVSVAYAQGADAAQQSPFIQFVPLVLILGVFWFLIIRPQQKKQKELKLMIDELKKGDKIVTNGGIFGSIVKVGDDRITLEIASKVQIQLERSQIARMDQKSSNKEDKKDEKQKEDKKQKEDEKDEDTSK